jgi:hypothetical protein
MELCLARAPKRAQALANSENRLQRRRESYLKWLWNWLRLGVQIVTAQMERGPETQLTPNSRAAGGDQPSTKGRGIQSEAGKWLPERYIARKKIALLAQRRLQTIDIACTSVKSFGPISGGGGKGSFLCFE